MSEPSQPTALYRVFGDADLLLYIGISKNFGARWKQHAKAQPWWDEHRRFTVEMYPSWEEAKAAETAAIKTEGPKHNKAENPNYRAARGPRHPMKLPATGTARANPVPAFRSRMLPGFPAMGDYLISSPGGIDRALADVPEEEREAARALAEARLLEIRVQHIAFKAMRTLKEVELDDPRLTPLARQAWQGLRRFVMECGCCDDKPPAGMACQECGAKGPAHQGWPAVRNSPTTLRATPYPPASRHDAA